MARATVKGQPSKSTAFRVRFVIDHDYQFEECNGKSRPLTEQEYAENQYSACPDHPRAGSKVLDTSVSPNAVGCAVCGLDGAKYQPINYDEYRAWYGNPDKHVYLQCEVQKGCPCCGAWETVGGPGGIDFMENAPELNSVDHWFTAEELAKIPGYLREVAAEELDEAGYGPA